MDTVSLGITVSRRNRVVIFHRWEIGTFTVKIFHDCLSHLRRLQCVLVKVLSLPVHKAFLNHLCHSLIIFLIKRNEQIGFILNFIGIVTFLTNDTNSIIVDITWEIRAVAFTVVVGSKSQSCLVEQRSKKLPFQLVSDKAAQVSMAQVSMAQIRHKQLHLLPVPFHKFHTHQVMFHTPTQINCHMVVGVDFIYWQILFLYGFQMPNGIVHLINAVAILNTAQCASCNGILTIRFYYKADALHFIQ